MYQRILVIGHLGKDPEMRYTPSGQAVTSFSLATSRRWTGTDGQQQEKTTWFRVTAWGKLAELSNQYLTKGKLALVEGEIDASAWTGQDGKPRASLELTARNIRFLGGAGGRGEEYDASHHEGAAVNEDEIPF